MKQSIKIKLTKTLMIFIIPLLLVGAGLIGYELITGGFKGIIRTLFIGITFILMLWFCLYIFRGITKYEREFCMPEPEQKRKWKTLSPEYKKFYNGFDRIVLIFYLILFLLGLSEILVYKNWNGLTSVIIAVLLGSLYLRQRIKYKNGN